jgi:hypothetical protein
MQMKLIASLERGLSRSTMIMASAFLAMVFGVSAFAAAVEGTVTNKTTNKPGANDDVVLIALAQNMQEVAKTKTDSRGHYRIDLPDSGMHLIRVDHQKASYFGPVAPGATNVNVTVYDVSPKVDALTMEADMIRVETDDQGLHVIESYFVKNDSAPPRTQLGPKSFEIYLPAEAKIDASIAMGPSGMPVASAPVPSGEPGHYAFIFPVRPGETRFQVEYHLPDSDSHTLQMRMSLPTANYALVLPKTMTFTSGNGVSFEPMNGDVNTKSLLAKNLSAMQAISYTVRGRGTLPRGTASGENNSSTSSKQPEGVTSDSRPGGGLAAPIDTPDPLSKYKWWIMTGMALVLAIMAGVFLQPNRSLTGESESFPVQPTPMPQQSSRDILLAALKNELFSLETERLQDKLSTEEYQRQKGALEIVMKRALTEAMPSAAAETQKDSLAL